MSETQSSCSSHSQVITCKAVVCWGIGEAGKVEEIQVEPPKASEVRVKMLNASLCHTDILISKGHPISARNARIVCRERQTCASNILYRSPVSCRTALQECLPRDRSCTMYFLAQHGQEYMVVNVNYLVKLPPTMITSGSFPLPHASFLSCGFSTGFGAPWKEAKLEKGSTVAVIGLGAVGLGGRQLRALECKVPLGSLASTKMTGKEKKEKLLE
ncbi:PREDICTED: alcohol dehydrogenase [Prunus dulcis]|uniref:PREDICTED: alcohol dehydrogenase n=1 Tax=Prunus dulcis TaxID=3755 RepID=A0A5E4E6S2_PRUDU|nr:PREDICTED: alcohol dehydrogenase [Prunus dulcis]